ncbi:MAG: regulatory protein RecX [Pseudomonadota bacterium]
MPSPVLRSRRQKPRRLKLTKDSNDPVRDIRDICLKLLSRREHSTIELKRKLSAKGFQGELVDEVVNELAADGWQSDARFAEEYLRQRIRRGYGPVRLFQELKQRGAVAVDLDQILRELDETWDDLIERVYRKKYHDSIPDSLNEISKRLRFLQYRGFTADQVKSLFDRLGQRF